MTHHYVYRGARVCALSLRPDETTTRQAIQNVMRHIDPYLLLVPVHDTLCLECWRRVFDPIPPAWPPAWVTWA
jgi:hypothetical protein